MTVRRTSRRLADGRKIIYFDHTEPYASGAADRDAVDGRRSVDPDAGTDAGAAAVGSGTMRYDVLTGEWVALAAHRMTRTHLPSRAECPLCPTRDPARPTEVPEADYDVVVFENRFPSFAAAAEPAGPFVDGEPLWPARPATGRCEVVVFSPEHDASFADLPPDRVRVVVEAWADRTAELSRLPGVEQVFCFENRGAEIGVTLHHPHGQIYAYPFVTPRTAAVLRQAAEHHRRTGGNLLRDVLDAERRAATRIVVTAEHWTAYVPAAARWPVEVHLAPHRDVPDLAALDPAERDELAVVYHELLQRLDRFFDGVERLPYVAAWHQAPVRVDRQLGRLYLQVFSVLRAPGKLKYLAGSESAMGAWVNDTTPEAIAERLRRVAS